MKMNSITRLLLIIAPAAGPVCLRALSVYVAAGAALWLPGVCLHGVRQSLAVQGELEGIRVVVFVRQQDGPARCVVVDLHQVKQWRVPGHAKTRRELMVGRD